MECQVCQYTNWKSIYWINGKRHCADCAAPIFQRRWVKLKNKLMSRRTKKLCRKKSVDCKSWPTNNVATVFSFIDKQYDGQNEKLNKVFKTCRRCGALNHRRLCSFCMEENNL